ncbi:MAG: tetratricopeptide repeat protein [Blastocatellia bacterium]
MKYAFLRTNLSLAIIGLVVGLVVGFKAANWQYRRAQGAVLQNSVAQANRRLPQSRSPGSESSQNLTPEQREQMVKEVKAIIEKAKSTPNDIEAQLEAADQFIQISRPDEAIQFLEQAAKANPNDARTQHGFGIVYSLKGQFDEAVKAAKRSLELSPNNPRVEMLLAATFIQAKTHLDEAETLLKKLETSGAISPDVIASARDDLKLARTAGSTLSPKTMLGHGPEEPKNPR